MHSLRIACLLLFVGAAASACGGAGGTGGPLAPISSRSDSVRPDEMRCGGATGIPCPTPAPTPTPDNGPVGSSYDVHLVGSNPRLLTSTTSHVIYVNPEPQIGDQVTFLKNLVSSPFFSYIVDQYVSGHGTYSVDPAASSVYVQLQSGYLTINTPLGTQNGATCPPGSVPIDGNMCQFEEPIHYYDQTQIMTAVRPIIKNGKATDVWHIIVPGDNNEYLCQPGAPLSCWGPGPTNKDECGEHDPIASSYGTTYYTIQQAMPDCNSVALNDSNPEADGVSSTLSHELFETITDPDGVSGWHYSTQEIGDECNGVNHWIALPYYSLLNNTGVFYNIQSEWSNKDAHCYPEVDQSPLQFIPLALRR